MASAAAQATSSPSGWYELLRFGRNLGPDPLPATAAHWREIPTATGTIWADLNAPGSFKFSEADFLAVMGWNFFKDDTTPLDQRCDSVNLKRWIRDPDPANAQRMESAQLGVRLGKPSVRQKLKRSICKFPTEWEQATIQTRMGWVREPKNGFGLEDDANWDRFMRHCQAMTFSDLPASYLGANWRVDPAEFIGVMRRCGWLSKREVTQLFPGKGLRNAGARGWVLEDVYPEPLGIELNFLVLNQSTRKYGITTPQRLGAFYGNAMQETQWFRLLAEGGGSTTRYAPWFGRGFLQLTWPDNYIKYWGFRARAIDANLVSQLIAATQQARQQRNNSALQALEASLPAEMTIWRDALKENRTHDASDSAGAYWAWSGAARSADAKAAFVRVVQAASGQSVVYYTHSSFGNVAATVNVGHPPPTTANHATNYHVINGVQARFQAYTAAMMVLADSLEFPNATGQMQPGPEAWIRRTVP